MSEPQNPVPISATTSFQSFDSPIARLTVTPVSNPRMNEPTRLTVNVPNGKSVPFDVRRSGQRRIESGRQLRAESSANHVSIAILVFRDFDLRFSAGGQVGPLAPGSPGTVLYLGPCRSPRTARPRSSTRRCRGPPWPNGPRARDRAPQPCRERRVATKKSRHHERTQPPRKCRCTRVWRVGSGEFNDEAEDERTCQVDDECRGGH